MKMTLLAVLTLTAWVETAFSADTPAPQKTIGINPAYRNLSVKPGDDFEEYANGGWRKTAEIPPDRASTGAGFEVFQRAEQRHCRSRPRGCGRESAVRHAAGYDRQLLCGLHGHGQHRKARP